MAVNSLKKIPSIKPDSTPFQPVQVADVYIEKINMTRDTVAALVKYCQVCGVKTYVGVREACKYALSTYIHISDLMTRSSIKYTLASKSREFADQLDFLVDKTASELGIYPITVPPALILNLEVNRRPNPVEFLFYTYLLMPNLDPLYFIENMNNIKTSVNVLLDRLCGTKHSSLQSMLYLYSTEGGVGKSIFQNIIYEWAKQRHVNAVYTRVPHNQFVGDEFYRNAICLFSDITQQECKNWNKINDLVDGSTYVVEKKGKDRYELKAQAFLIGSSNFHPNDENNRRISHSIVNFSSNILNPISKFPDVFKLNDAGKEVDIDYYIPIVDKWIQSCPEVDFSYSDFKPLYVSTAQDWYEGIEDDYAYVLRAIADYLWKKEYNNSARDGFKLNLSSATLKNRLNNAVKADEIHNIDSSMMFSKKQVYHILRHLAKRKMIKVSGGGKGSYEKEYDLSKFVKASDRIRKEHNITVIEGSSFRELPDYVQQKSSIIYVARQILQKTPMELSPECWEFLRTAKEDIGEYIKD